MPLPRPKNKIKLSSFCMDNLNLGDGGADFQIKKGVIHLTFDDHKRNASFVITPQIESALRDIRDNISDGYRTNAVVDLLCPPRIRMHQLNLFTFNCCFTY